MGYKVNYNSVVFEMDGKKVAFIEYPEINKDLVNIKHTFVSESLRGNGIASSMMQMVVQQLERTNRKAKVTCSYAAGWFKKNPQYRHLLYKVDK